MINSLQQALYLADMEVEIQHYRVPASYKETAGPPKGAYHPRLLRECDQQINPRGGVTFVKITRKDGLGSGLGDATCSMSDNFDRHTGTLLALQRAIEGAARAKSYAEFFGGFDGSGSIPSLPV